jgi:hypothetical protein
MLDRRLALAEERAEELEELVDVMRAQRDRLQTCYEQKDRADGLDAACRAQTRTRAKCRKRFPRTRRRRRRSTLLHVGNLAAEEKKKLSESIGRALSTGD